MVLAGGNGLRMGGNKARLRVGGETCLARAMRVLARFCQEVVVTTSEALPLEPPPPARQVEDLYPGRGPLAGIHAGLAVARHPRCLVVACDMPFLRPELVELLLARAKGEEAVVCQIRGYLEPFPGVYPRGLGAHMERALREGKLGVQDLLRRVPLELIPEPHVRQVDPRLQSFINLNSPADLARLEIHTDLEPASG